MMMCELVWLFGERVGWWKRPHHLDQVMTLPCHLALMQGWCHPGLDTCREPDFGICLER